MLLTGTSLYLLAASSVSSPSDPTLAPLRPVLQLGPPGMTQTGNSKVSFHLRRYTSLGELTVGADAGWLRSGATTPG
jgi:hypothetical protein